MRQILLLLILLLISACTAANPTPPATPQPTATALPPTPTPTLLSSGTDEFPWWNDAVFYEVFVRSFYDSDGDGIGDLNGLIEKLDYINDGDPATDDDLGATAIWLMPIALSPSYHGYDVVDYLQVDPEYGTNEDFKRLMEAAHARGIRVIVDLVLNHTSSQHPWFIESQRPDSEKRDWYLWEAQQPDYRGPWGQEVWHKSGDAYYYGVFWGGMPDLNFANPDVTAAMYDAAEFWLSEMGVDGFRLDAIKHMVEDGRFQENTAATHAWLEGFHDFYKDVSPDALTVGEAWTGTDEVVDYTGDEVDIAFQFDLADEMLRSATSGLAKNVATMQTKVVTSFPPNQYATFLTNHDQNRVMSRLKGDVDKARIAASLLLTGPGVPFVYYGEEIGMSGMKPDEDIRLPMQWRSDVSGVGFSEGTPWRAPADDYSAVSVALQMDDDESLLTHYRALIRLRNTHAALRVGDWTLVETNSPRVYAFLRRSQQEVVLVVMNLSREVISAENYNLNLTTSQLSTNPTAISLYGDSPTAAPLLNAAGGFDNYIPFAQLAPRSTHIIQLQGQ